MTCRPCLSLSLGVAKHWVRVPHAHAAHALFLSSPAIMADDVAGISKTTEGSIHLQPKTPTTRTTACKTPKTTSTFSKRPCGLRRPSSPFVSPVLKRSCEEKNQEIFSTPKRSKYDKQSLLATSENNPEEIHAVELLTEKRDLIKTIQQREDSLRKLKLVKMYRIKNDLSQLQGLIDKWRTVSQEAAERLLAKIKLDPLPTMGQLLSNLQIDKQLIHYSEEDETFY